MTLTFGILATFALLATLAAIDRWHKAEEEKIARLYIETAIARLRVQSSTAALGETVVAVCVDFLIWKYITSSGAKHGTFLPLKKKTNPRLIVRSRKSRVQ
jgi:P2-related tail formation protein